MINQTLEGLSYEIRLYHQSGVQVWHNGENITERVAKAKFCKVSYPKPKKEPTGVACIYVLKENGKEVCRGGFEKCQSLMYKMARADMEGAGDRPREVKHGEDYYSRVEAETLARYSLKIEPVG